MLLLTNIAVALLFALSFIHAILPPFTNLVGSITLLFATMGMTTTMTTTGMMTGRALWAASAEG